MTITVMSMYPKGAEFNLEYYTKVHKPPIYEAMKPFGFSNPRIMVPKTEDNPYEIISMGDFPDWESFERYKAETPASYWEEWRGRAKNFTKIVPIQVVMETTH
ncbi:hypothetical protein B0I35DRAFT_484253 [Stachybotrys elegans]|uniref:EthD domain-containing protein n=1 Tax=Stachybotrys elegans TaxID=80388 RepID=A0A8K0SDQ4_9HYPO|nr:hypothetical protein B0I35DRAFT_484253 [Stachybotrys elegans]